MPACTVWGSLWEPGRMLLYSLDVYISYVFVRPVVQEIEHFHAEIPNSHTSHTEFVYGQLDTF